MKLLKIGGLVLAGLVVLGGGGIFYMASNLKPSVVLGSESPDVTFETLDGESLALSSLRGKVVLLDFWRST